MGNILSRIQEIAHKEGITIGALERTIGASKGVLSRAISNGTDIQSKWLVMLVANYPLYSTRWLLTGEGSMLHESVQLRNEPVSVSSDAVTMRLMDKLDDKEAENKHLQSELRAKSEELAVLKAQYPHESPPDVVIEEIREVLGSPRTAKHANTKPHSSTSAPSAGSVQPHRENQ